MGFVCLVLRRFFFVTERLVQALGFDGIEVERKSSSGHEHKPGAVKGLFTLMPSSRMAGRDR